jgi:hypothetical protein
MDFEPRYPKCKEEGVVTGAVLFGEIKQNKSCTSLSTFFFNLQETQRKVKETTGRKHKKESIKDGRDETEIPEWDAEKIRESEMQRMQAEVEQDAGSGEDHNDAEWYKEGGGA